MTEKRLFSKKTKQGFGNWDNASNDQLQAFAKTGSAVYFHNCILAGVGFALSTSLCIRASSAEIYAMDALLAGTAKDVQLWIPSNGVVRVAIARLSADAPSQASVQVSAFRGEYDGRELKVELLETNLIFQSNQVFAAATLQVKPDSIEVLQKYVGSLALSTNGAPAVIWRITLNDPRLSRPATLIVDPGTLKHPITEGRFHRSKVSMPQVTVTLREKSGLWPLEGIGVSLVAVTAPERATFDLARNIIFFLGTNEIRSLTESALLSGADRDLRTIPAGGQRQLGLAFHDLKPGQYTVELKLFAVNSQQDPQQKLTITVQKADSVGLALITLLAALAISFFSYKWLKLYAQRVSLRKRIAALRPGWLSYRDPLYAVVWVRTVLKQAEGLASRIFSIFPPALVTEQIDRVPPVLEALDQAGQAEERLGELPPLARHRLTAVIVGHVKSISDHNMDKDVTAKAKGALAALNSDLGEQKWFACYAAEIQRAAIAFLRIFDEKSMPPQSLPRVREFKKKLEDSVKTLLTETEEVVTEFEKHYARLKILYECRHYEEFDNLLQKIDGALEEVFRVADDATWERIKKAPITIRSFEREANETLEAYRPLKFFLSTGDKSLDATYLLNRGLHFKWRFTLTRCCRRPVELEPLTHSPRISQFAPHHGNLKVFVEIQRDVASPAKLPAPPPGAEPKSAENKYTIEKSPDLGFVRGVELTEWCALAVAAMLAIVSGLLTFYYKNPTFGSTQDYLGLFLWGVGVEQMRNFLQVMQSSAKDSSPLTK